MKQLKLFTFITFLLVITCLKASDVEMEDENDAYDGDTDVFVATYEWQTIKPGQRIPSGLHIRMNLETGKKEAKLLDANDDSQTGKAVVALLSKQDDSEVPKDIREALRMIKDDGIVKETNSKHKFRSIDQIKEEFSALNIKMTSESDIVVRFVEELKQESDVTTERKIEILLELEYYAHQFDNARDFVKLGGLNIVIPLLESTSEDIRSSAAFLLGSLMQSNPSVQVSAAESGLIEKLLNRLNVDTSVAVQNKALYALSCMLRRFPHAQQKFLELGGLSVVTTFFGKYGREINRLQLKTVTMIYDLIVEDHFASNVQDESSSNIERLRQYGRVGMKRAVIEAKWCDFIPKLLNSSDHDMIEKVLRTMALISNDCRTEFLGLRHRLLVLQDEFSHLVDRDEDASYLYELLQTVVTLLKELEGSSKNEL